MQDTVKSLMQILRKTLEHFSDEQKSISLLIATGLKEQGTSTALKQAQLHQQIIDDEYGIQVFYNKKGIVIDINEHWIQSRKIPLNQLFKKINKCHRKLHISGFLFFIEISELLITEDDVFSTHIQKHAKYFQTFIQALDYPVRSGIVITKLDQITGFTDFFSMSHDLELQEPLGFSVTYTPNKNNFGKIFGEVWNNFVSYLNQLMIQKIHTTRANKQRILIREFPLQIALMESRFLKLLKNLTQPQTHIHGLFFTCAEQKGKNLNYLNKRIQNDFSVQVPISSIQSVNFKHFFIHGAIAHCQELSSYTPKPNLLFDPKFQAILFAGLLTSSLIIYQTIKANHVIGETDQHLKQPFKKNIPLRQLTTIENHIHDLKNLPILYKYMSNITLINQQLSNIEQKIYEKHMAYKVSVALQNQMMSNDLALSFEALKISLALLNHRQDQDQAIFEWFKHIYMQDFNDAEKDEQVALFKKFIWDIQWHIDENLIQITQTNLNSLPEEYLVFELLNQSLIQKTIPVSLPGFQQEQLSIPECYTKAAYAKTQKNIKAQFDNLRNNSWVLGHDIDPKLEQYLEKQYADKYVKYWKSVYKNLKPRHFTSFNDALNVLKALDRTQSFEKAMSLIIKETAPNIDKPSDSFNQLVANQFTELQFNNLQNNQMHPIWEELTKFTSMFAMMNDNGRASFQYLKAYFNQNQYNDALYNLSEYSKHLPEPTQSWLTQIQEDIWVTLEQSSRQYINHAWNEQIYQPYVNMLQNKFPFGQSENEVGINDFNTFFNPNGKIQQFYKEYLQTFINTSQAQWEIKEVDNKRLPIAEGVIDNLMRANVISHIFFPNNTSQTHIQFSIEKMTLDPVIANLSLNIGQQQLLDSQQENAYLQGVIWPEMNAGLHIDTIEGKNYAIEEKGIWGFFRLLDKLNVISDPNDPNTIQILVDINGTTGRYLVKTNNSVNPFIPGILKDFQLKSKIV